MRVHEAFYPGRRSRYDRRLGFRHGLRTGQIRRAGQNHILPDIHRTGRSIVSNFDIVEFYVPLFAHVTKVADIDYVEYYVRYGPKQDKLWLRFMFGGLVGGDSPNDLQKTSIKWTAQTWSCGRVEDGKDWRGSSGDGLRWRHVSIPFGFAAYEGAVPSRPPGSSRRAGGYSPALRLTRLPCSLVPKRSPSGT